MAFGPITQTLLDQMGWRWSQRVLAAICLIGLLGIVLYKPLGEQADGETDDTKYPVESVDKGHNDNKLYKKSEHTRLLQETDEKYECCGNLNKLFRELLRFYCRLDFMVFGVAFFCYSWAYDSPLTFIPLRAQEKGISGPKASNLLTYFGLSGIIVRLTTLVLPIRKFKMIMITTGFGMFIAGLSSTLMPLFTTYPGLVTYSVWLGSSLGKCVCNL